MLRQPWNESEVLWSQALLDFMSACPPVSDGKLLELRVEPAMFATGWSGAESRARFIIHWGEPGPGFIRGEGLRVCAQDSSLKGSTGPEFLRFYGRMFAREGFSPARSDDLEACSGQEPSFVVFYRPLPVEDIVPASHFGPARIMLDLDPLGIAAALHDAWVISNFAEPARQPRSRVARL